MNTFRRLESTVLFACSVVVAWHPLMTTLKLANENEAFTHIFLIPPLFVAFIYADCKRLRSVVKPNVLSGSLILCVAGMIAWASRWHAARMTVDVQLSINMLALVIWWIGSFVFCFGTRVSRSMLFPLCFLFWMVPLPSFALDQIVKALQQGSALATRLLFAAARVPVAQDGLMLSIPGLTVEVAKECSSIRSSLMLLVTTMVLAQLLLHSPWRKVLVIGVSVPLSVAKNGVRIFTIATLGTRVDPGFLTGRLHHQGGIVFFAIALCAIFFLIWILRRAEAEVIRAAVLRPASPETVKMVSG